MRVTLCFLAWTTLAFGLAPTASADFLSGNDLYEDCRIREGKCAPLIVAFTDMLTYLHGSKYVCIPRNVNVGQLADIYVEHARQNAAQRNKSAAGLFRDAMVKAFPC